MKRKFEVCSLFCCSIRLHWSRKFQVCFSGRAALHHARIDRIVPCSSRISRYRRSEPLRPTNHAPARTLAFAREGPCAAPGKQVHGRLRAPWSAGLLLGQPGREDLHPLPRGPQAAGGTGRLRLRCGSPGQPGQITKLCQIASAVTFNVQVCSLSSVFCCSDRSSFTKSERWQSQSSPRTIPMAESPERPSSRCDIMRQI